MASLKENGYAQYAHGGTMRNAHRVAYGVLVATIPVPLTVDHLCRVRHCVNPAHMELVTQKVNSLRGDTLAARGARTTECPVGHPYDRENTYRYAGKRRCRACHRDQERRAYHLRKGSSTAA